jgi:hypothetical protein
MDSNGVSFRVTEARLDDLTLDQWPIWSNFVRGEGLTVADWVMLLRHFAVGEDAIARIGATRRGDLQKLVDGLQKAVEAFYVPPPNSGD